ncbi:MAG: sigma 54-interacting transcriptional regulator [Solirubrobacteraceae bacterium]
MSAALAGRGYKAIEDADATPPSAPGVVLFERVADDVCALIRRLSQGSRRRVVAVSLAPEGLAGSAPWELLAAGAADALSWKGAATARELAARFERWREVDKIVDSPLVGRNLVGDDQKWRLLIRSIVEVAAFSRAPVVITGESGTGKELVARLVHALDRRRTTGRSFATTTSVGSRATLRRSAPAREFSSATRHPSCSRHHIRSWQWTRRGTRSYADSCRPRSRRARSSGSRTESTPTPNGSSRRRRRPAAATSSS